MQRDSRKAIFRCQICSISTARISLHPIKCEGESDSNLEIMRKIDHQYTEHPAMGTRQMVDYLKAEGFMVGRKLVRRLMALHSGLGALQYA